MKKLLRAYWLLFIAILVASQADPPVLLPTQG